jgi:hypothetical protein
VHLCYIDESGTPDVPGNTSHFVLAGISIPIGNWRTADRSIAAVLRRYDLAGEELHTAWVLRSYLEQSRIPNFDQLSRDQRRVAVERERNRELLQLQKDQKSKAYQQQKKTFAHTRPYIHLTRDERRGLVQEIADCVSDWSFARLFAECIDKIHFDPSRTVRSVGEQAFEQVVSRFEQYLVNTDAGGQKNYGLLVHDNNETVAKRHTDLMRRFHQQGTFWTTIHRIIETPMFVDSRLTSMVQIADLCSYALRRYLENQEGDLFTKIFSRADRVQARVLGVRHFAPGTCMCDICRAHRPIGG